MTHQVQLFIMQTLDSAGNHSRRTSMASRHIQTIHSPYRRSISRAIAPRRTSVASQLIKASRSPYRRSISKIPAHDIRQGQHNTSKPPIPHIDARLYILGRSTYGQNNLRLKKHISGIAANTKSKPAMPHADAPFCKQPLKNRISGITTNSTSRPTIPRVDARFCKRPLKNRLKLQWHRSKEQIKTIKTSHSNLQAYPRILIDTIL